MLLFFCCFVVFYVKEGDVTKRKVVVVSVSPQSRASIAAAYNLTAEEVSVHGELGDHVAVKTRKVEYNYI